MSLLDLEGDRRCLADRARLERVHRRRERERIELVGEIGVVGTHRDAFVAIHAVEELERGVTILEEVLA